MLNGFFPHTNLLRDPGTDGGGGSAATAIAPAAGAPSAPAAAAPAAAPSSAPAGAPAPASAAAPAGGGAPAPAAAPAFKSALEGLPQRGSAEYIKAFNDLPRERQQAIEAEVLDRDLNPQKYAELEKAPVADPAAGADGTVELGWTEEQLAALDPHTQASIKAMQETIDQVAPYIEGGKLKAGMEILVNDPVVKARMAQLSKGEDPYAIPSELEDEFDPSAYMTREDLAAIDLQLKPKESREMLAAALQKAFEDGAKKSSMRAEYEKNSAVSMVRRQSLFSTQLTKLMSDNPSLKSDKPFSDASHPLHEYVKWAGDNLGDDFLEQHGQEVGFATFLAAKGKMKETMHNVAKNTQLTFIRAIENGDKKVAMMQRGGPASPPVSTNPEYGGVDTAKYLADPIYRRNAFQNAKPEVRRKLESLSATGKL